MPPSNWWQTGSIILLIKSISNYISTEDCTGYTPKFYFALLFRFTSGTEYFTCEMNTTTYKTCFTSYQWFYQGFLWNENESLLIIRTGGSSTFLRAPAFTSPSTYFLEPFLSREPLHALWPEVSPYGFGNQTGLTLTLLEPSSRQILSTLVSSSVKWE